MKVEGGKRKTESGKRESGTGPMAFAQVMREQGMAVPQALDESMRSALGDERRISAEETLKAAEQLLGRVLAGECESRESALDLLTVDALVTRALEIAAHDPDLLAKFPELAMKRISTR